MTPIHDFLDDLERNGIAIWAERGQLRYKGPASALTAAVIERMRDARNELLDLLQNRRDVALGSARRRFWILNRMHPGSDAHVMPAAIRLTGTVKNTEIQAALTKIVHRHEALRTVFPEVDGEPRARIVPAAPIELPVHVLSGIPEEARDNDLEQRLHAWVRQPFDILNGPIYRFALLQYAPGDCVLLLSFHHIAVDGGSLSVLAADFFGFLSQTADDSPAPGYAAVIRRRDAELTPERVESLLAYWRQRLAGVPPLTLPADQPRPSHRSFAGNACHIVFGPARTAALRRLAMERETTLFSLLLAILAVMLHRYSGQDEFAIGSPIAERSTTDELVTVGPLLNTLAFRVRLSGGRSFSRFLEDVHAWVMNDLDHRALPFEKLVERLAPDRDPAANPFYNVSLNVQTAAPSVGNHGRLRSRMLELPTHAARNDLHLDLVDGVDGLQGKLEFATDVFDPRTVSAMVRHLLALSDSVLAQPSSTLRDLSLAPASEVMETIARLNPVPPVDFPPAPSVEAAIAAHAGNRPDAIAIVTANGSQSLTYRMLVERASRLAEHLRAPDAGEERLVALILERDADTIVAMLAVLMAGYAYVPLAPDLPRHRLGEILTDSRACCVVTKRAHADRLDGLPVARCVLIDEDVRAVASPPPRSPASTAPTAATAADALAYVIYTSGSTGRPKGVGVSRRSLIRLLHAGHALFRFSASDVWTMFHTPSFDFSVWEIWGALYFGGQVIVTTHDIARNPDDFARLVRRSGVTVLNQTPTAFSGFRDVVLASGPAALPSLRLVIFGGEALATHVVRPWIERHGDERPAFVNMYGLTEATVHVTWHRITCADTARASCPIGLPLPDLRVYLLDDALRPTPVGVPGEICVSGPGLARGYLGEPALTAEKYLPDPLAPQPGARMYRSGDTARLRHDGQLEFLGRRDGQVKVRGYRIELNEIRAALASHPDVSDAAVLVRPNAEDLPRLVACVVAATARQPDSQALRAHLADRVPGYMIPASFHVMPSLPLTSNGKLDQRALPLLASESPPGGLRSPPRSVEEETLVAIFARLLDAPGIGADDSFFAAGGDSILAIRATALAAQRGLQFSVEDLFRHQSATALAAAISRTGETRRPAEPSRQPFDMLTPAQRRAMPEDAVDAYPLTGLQLAMLYAAERDRESRPYHDVFALELRCAPCVDPLQAAVDRAVARHPVLRTSLHLSMPGEPLQIVHRTARLSVEVLPHAAPGGVPMTLEARVSDMLRQPFALERAPLARLLVSPMPDGSAHLVFAFHHAILDGWSAASLLTEIFDPASGAAPAALFRDLVARERQALDDTVTRDFWAERLQADDSGPLPAGEESAAGETERVREAVVPSFESIDVDVPAELHDALAGRAARLGVPVRTLLLAAHLRVLAALTGQRQVATGIAVNGRPDSGDGDTVLGLFVNVIPLHLVLSGTWGDLVHSIQRAEADLMPYRYVPATALRQMQHGKPPFSAVFNFANFHVYERLRARIPDIVNVRVHEQTDLPLAANFGIRARDGRLTMRLVRSRGTLTAPCFRRLPFHYLQALTAAAGPADEPLSAAVLPSPAELACVTGSWATGRPVPPTASIPAAFARQVRRTPDAIAVSMAAGTNELSYAELDRQSHAVATYLRNAHDGRPAIVAFLLPRTPRMIVAMLGILKSGAAYLPLDGAYPDERLSRMLAIAEVTTILTDPSSEIRIRSLAPAGAIVITVPPTTLPNNAGCALPDVSPEAVAYVNFTSGSTGAPKAIAIPHAGVTRMAAHTDLCSTGPGTVSLFLSSPSFDATTLEVWGALLTGGRLLLCRDSGDLFADLREATEHGCNRLFLTAALFRELVDAEPGLLIGLRHLMTGGEVVSPTHLRLVRARYPDLRLTVLYGPTENTVVSTFHTVTGASPASDIAIIGRPVDGSTAFVLDPFGQPSPIGAIGELHVGGPGLARGYLGKAALTAEKFRDHHQIGTGQRLYQTGDLARWREDGTLVFVGRADRQVKLRGFRIEPAEIETALRAEAGIREAVVMPRTSADGHTRLAAYVVAAGSDPLIPRIVIARLANRLPAFMVPNSLTVLDCLPRSPNGKIDRAALPEPVFTAPVPADIRTDTERRMAALWGDVLGVPVSGGEANFFQLGGHSLYALRLIARVRAQWTTDLPLAALFEHPSLAGFAAALDCHRQQSSGNRAALSALLPSGGEAAAENVQRNPSPVQEHYLALRRRSGYANAYSEFLVRRPGPGFAEAVRHAAMRLVDRHPILCETVTGEPHAGLTEDAKRRCVTVTDLRTADATHALTVVASAKAALRIAAPALERWPLFDLHLHLLPDGDVSLQFRLDALIADGATRVMLLRELLALIADPDSPATDRALRFSDWQAALPGLKQSEDWRRARDAWHLALTDLPLPFGHDFIRDVSRPAAPGVRKRTLLPPSSWVRLRAVLGHEAVTPSTFLTAAFLSGLSEHAGRQPYLAWQATSYRPPIHPHIDRTLGNFTTVLPLAVHRPDVTLPASITDIEAMQRRLLDHRLYSGFDAIAQLAATHGLGREKWLSAMVNCLIDYSPRPDHHDIAIGDRTIRIDVVEEILHLANLLVAATFQEAMDSSLVCQLTTADDVLPDGFADRLLDSVARVCQQKAADAGLHVRQGGDQPCP
ncbi:non-ribosomal peptide synthetase [Burkholderia ubonensis]|uniref:Carrier domain-containing protein n=1 Tax=Burkholderia ubonensis TaxID=101571 RepID=A0ABD4E7P4_9BURK|nr:non-ribosomal peptide synthetase [Burkholderia ubonensis]KVN88988.1 hypothetical protein WJ68_05665 [Burkholderia ubonensis]